MGSGSSAEVVGIASPTIVIRRPIGEANCCPLPRGWSDQHPACTGWSHAPHLM